MNREQIETLKNQAEQLCGQAYQSVVNATTEWHKYQGEFRAYDALLLNWSDDIPEEDKVLDTFDVKTLKKSTIKESTIKKEKI